MRSKDQRKIKHANNIYNITESSTDIAIYHIIVRLKVSLEKETFSKVFTDRQRLLSIQFYLLATIIKHSRTWDWM